MAEDTVEQESQDLAKQKVDVPEAVTVNADEPNHGEYLQQNEAQKDALNFYGYTDLQQFLQMIGSDGAFAQKVVSHLLGVDKDAKFSGAKEAFSSQENNVTGLFTNKSETPVKFTPTATEPVQK